MLYLFRIDCKAVDEDSEYVQMLEMKQTVPLLQTFHPEGGVNTFFIPFPDFVGTVTGDKMNANFGAFF